MGVGGAGVAVDAGAGVVVGVAGVAASAVVAPGVGVGGVGVAASAVVATGVGVAIGAGDGVAAGIGVAVGAGVGAHAISSEVAAMDSAASNVRLVIILIARLDIDGLLFTRSFSRACLLA